MKITSYFVFNGQAEEAAGFYADLLHGTIGNLYRYNQCPPSDGQPEIPAGYGEKLMHTCIAFPGGSIGLSDALPSDRRTFGNGGHMVTLMCDSIAQAEEAYAKLRDGAQKIDCELCETFYAKRYGEVVDKYGILWAVMFEG